MYSSRTIKFGIFICMMWTSFHAVSQNCAELMQQADTNVGIGDFRKAYDNYLDGAMCFKMDSSFGMYLRSRGFALDCLEKLSEFDALEKGIHEQEELILRYTPFISPGELNPIRFTHRLFTGLQWSRLGNIEAAISIFQTELDSIQHLPADTRTQFDSLRRSKILIYLSEAYLNQGNFDLAVSSAYEAIDLNASTRELLFNDGSILKPLLFLAESQYKAGTSTDAWKTVSSIQSIVNALKARKIERAILVSGSILHFYLQSGNLDSAYVYLTRLQELDTLRQHRAEILQLTGEYYAAAGDKLRAERKYREALSVVLLTQGEKSEAVAGTNLALGQLYLGTQRFEPALECFHHGLYCMSGAPEAVVPALTNPPLSSLYAHRSTLKLLGGKATSLHGLYRQRANPRYLDAAWQSIRLAVHCLDNLRAGYSAEKDKSLLIDDSYPIFEEALSIALTYQQNTGEERWLDSAFVLMEESKALNLRDAVLHGQARRFAGIPDSLLRFENTLRLEISGKDAMIRKYRASPLHNDSTEIAMMTGLAEKKEQYRALIGLYERNHPAYYALKHKRTVILISTMRGVLGPHQTLLEYFIGDSAIFIIKINAHEQELYRVEKDFPLAAWVSTYRSSLNNFAQSKSIPSLAAYAEAANQLYDKLFPMGNIQDTSLLIIPDGILGYISFSSLLRTAPEDVKDIRHFDYLLWHHNISYSYSANLYLELLAPQPQSDGGALICAPEFSGFSDRTSLKYNLQEAQSIRKIIGGQLLSGANCTVEAFHTALSDAPRSILHLATHGSANDETGDASYLVFTGNDQDSVLLYANDLYNLDMPIDLVYLSACETGTGELRRGEGIISLARAFFYAGVKSLVTTLWRVEDSRSGQISEAFYRYVKKGSGKDQALGAAQRDYIHALPPTDKIYAHPVYWSALIPVGNMHHLQLETPFRVFMWIKIFFGASAVFLLFLLVLRVRNK